MSTNQTESTHAFTLLMIHGRGPKPAAADMLRHWRTALTAGLKRDYPDFPALDRVELKLVYYADLTAEIVDAGSFNPIIDLADRQNALDGLIARKTSKQFRRVHYESVPGKSSVREFLADIGAPVSRALGLGEKAVAKVLPELPAYWENRNGYADRTRARFLDALLPPLRAGNSVMVLSHCLGSIIAYDALWQMSHGDAAPVDQRIQNWLTIGSPLADDFIRNRLCGGRAHPGTEGAVSYPNVLVNWLNVAAEDDYFCHDETMANDYAPMLRDRLVSRVKDYHIYNLTERFGKSDPHGSLGYLIHPRISRLIHDWLGAESDT